MITTLGNVPPPFRENSYLHNIAIVKPLVLARRWLLLGRLFCGEFHADFICRLNNLASVFIALSQLNRDLKLIHRLAEELLPAHEKLIDYLAIRLA